MKEKLTEFYRAMVTIRLAEERIGELVEAGEVHCPCHLYIGQEAIAVGICSALGYGDTAWGTHRSHGHYLAQGASLRGIMAEVFGRVDGCSHGRGGSMHLFAQEQGILGTVPIVAATIPLAVGAGLAAKLRGDEAVSVAFFGDGATEEGHFHESLNFAALHRLPVIFACENNLYASHLHIGERRPEDNLNKVGDLYGVPSPRIDGNDVRAVHEAAVEACDRARSGAGPTFLECRTYRWRGHVGPRWDTDVGVKRRDELHEWMPKCPITRLKKQLSELGLSDQELSEIDESVIDEIDDAEAFAKQSALPRSDELMSHVFYANGKQADATDQLCGGDSGSARSAIGQR